MSDAKSPAESKPVDVAIAIPPPTTAPSASSSAEIIDLPLGKVLNEMAANQLSSSLPTRLIVLAGQSDSGKTTLLTSLYELFQSGPVSGHNFSGSATLPGFEERCNLGRTQSGNTVDDTQRTPYTGKPEFLHLQVSPIKAPHEHIDFLFTDVSGEMFDRASNSQVECENLRFLRHAAHFVILLDSEKGVGTEAEGWAMFQASRSLLQACLDSRMLSKLCFVTFVWSKYDHFESGKPEEQEAHTKFRQVVAKQIQDRFANRVAKLSIKSVAARPEQAPAMGFGNGVAQLFNDWIVDATQSRAMNLQPPLPDRGRESELFALRFASPDGL